MQFSHVYFCLDALPPLGQFPLLANFPHFGEYSSLLLPMKYKTITFLHIVPKLIMTTVSRHVYKILVTV
jgi:hypothetical protein